MILVELKAAICNAKLGKADYSGDDLYIPVLDAYDEVKAYVYLDDSKLDPNESLEDVNFDGLYVTDIQFK